MCPSTASSASKSGISPNTLTKLLPESCLSLEPASACPARTCVSCVKDATVVVKLDSKQQQGCFGKHPNLHICLTYEVDSDEQLEVLAVQSPKSTSLSKYVQVLCF